MSYEVIEHIEVGSGGSASIEFTSIPATYTDLYLVTSLRCTRSTGDYDLYEIKINGSALTSGRILEGTGSSVSSESRVDVGVQNISTDTANTFNNAIHYIPNYAGSTSKSISSDSVAESNTTAAGQVIAASLTTDTNAVSSISLHPDVGNFVEYSSATLYGIRKYDTAGSPKATGGIISFDSANNKWVHTFTASGTFTPTEDLTCEYLVVAGGGGGGNVGGGGGAGGYRSSVSGESSGGGASAETPLSLTASTGYTVTIGSGGAGSTTTSGAGTNGVDSTFATVTSDGGGAGSGGSGTPANGGSGGGGRAASGTAGTGTAGQGFDGVFFDIGGGGGGASEDGKEGVTSGRDGGDGGDGVSSSITGSAITRAGGGGGGRNVTLGGTQGLGGAGGGANGGLNDTGFAGLLNTGGGGGGGSFNNPTSYNGGAGGSGIVIVRYAA